MSGNERSPKRLLDNDDSESRNNAANQRARLLGAFAMRIPVSSELAKTVFCVSNLGGRLQELRSLGWPIKTWRGLAKNSAGRPVALFGLYPPAGRHATLILAARRSAVAEDVEFDQDEGGANEPK